MVATQFQTQPKKAPTKQATKQYVLIWQTYACEEQDGYPVPLETKENVFFVKPSQSQIDQLRKHAHALGYKLVSFYEQKRYHHDEF